MCHHQIYAKIDLFLKKEEEKNGGRRMRGGVTHETQKADKCSHRVNENYHQNVMTSHSLVKWLSTDLLSMNQEVMV